jgi:competence protein ComEC
MVDGVMGYPGEARAQPRLLWAPRRLGACLRDERDRWALWLPVGVGTGIAGYFALPAEPPAWAGAAAVGAAGLVALVALPGVRWGFGRWRAGWDSQGSGFAAALLLLVVALGFAAAQMRTRAAETPVLTREMGPLAVTGRVAAVERMPAGVRVQLAGPVIARLDAAATPRRVRLRLPARLGTPPIGAVIRLKATLRPPPGPAEPGAFDARRQAYFDGIGAVGYSVMAWEVVAAPRRDGPWRAVNDWLEEMRAIIAGRVALRVQGTGAAVTAALLNGEQNAIALPVMQDFRASGLAHLLSISGLHIGLAAGLVFVTVRALLALIPAVALRWPLKKIAAAAGLVAAVAYTLLVGAPVPALRSVLMTGLALAAMIAGRDPLSMRAIAFAATTLLLMVPESLLGASFQMSFAAVVALIAAYEVAGGRIAAWRRGAGPVAGGFLYVAGVGFTSVVATAATTPFSLYHFHQFSLAGILSNMVAVPLTSFWVMPWGLIAMVLMPFGIEGFALVAMGWGVDATVWTAHVAAAMPGAILPVPAMPDAGFAGLVLGGLWLCLWSRRWRLFGLVPMMAGLASPLLSVRPDVFIAADGGLMAVRTATGGLSLSGRGDPMTADAWLRRDGNPTPEAPWPAQGVSVDGRLTCDPLGCLYRTAGRSVALVRDPQALAEDCAGVDAVVSAGPVRHCAAPLIVDRWTLRRDGGTALYVLPDGVHAQSVHDGRGIRPWTGR